MAKKNKALDLLANDLSDLGGSLLPSNDSVESEGRDNSKEKKELMNDKAVTKIEKSVERAPADEMLENIRVKESIEEPRVVKEVATSPVKQLQEQLNEAAQVDEGHGSTNFTIGDSLEGEFVKATAFFRDGNNALHLNIDDVTEQRISWVEQAISFKDSRRSKRLVLATMAEVFFQHYGKQVQSIIEKKAKEELKRMKGKF